MEDLDVKVGWPNLFLVGAPKCGTTSLATSLTRHPDIKTGADKEPWYLNTDFGPRKVLTEEAYVEFFRTTGPRRKFVCDASTTYLYSESARKTIARLPNARVIIIVRNPAEMVQSWHAQKVWTAEEDIVDFEEAWRAIPSRRAGLRQPRGVREPRWLLYDEMAALGSLTRRWVQDLGAERVMVLLLENMRDDPGPFFQSIFRFLGVTDDEVTDFGVHLNRRSRPKSLAVSRFLARLAEIKNQILPISFGLNLIARLRRMNSVPESGGRKISAAFERELMTHFSAEISILEQLTGVSLDHWRQPGSGK